MVCALRGVQPIGVRTASKRGNEDHMAVVGYCVKCKDKKEMVNPTEGVTKNGRVITKGTCPDCGTKMSLIGGVAKK